MGKANASLKVRSDLKNLPTIRSFIEKAAKEANLSDAGVSEIRLAVDEACANAILHGYKNSDGELDISVGRVGDNFIVTLSDNAPPYNPLEESPSLDLETPLEERSLGRMGVFLIKQNSDAVDYHATESGANVLTLTKFCADPPPPD